MAKAKEEIRSLARKHTATAINCLVGIMRQPKCAPAARVAAASALLDRGWGKPQQGLELTGKDGGPIQTEEMNAREVILGRIAGIEARSGTNGNPGKPH